MNYDLCVHLDMNDPSLLGLSLNNITNYMAALPEEKFHVCLVVNGPAVQLFKRESCPQAERVAALAARGVRFTLCINALESFTVRPADLLPECEINPAGVVELVRLQREGYAYIKP